MEINNCTERPVVTVPWEFSQISAATGHEVVLHSQNIVENLGRLYNSKYYVKLLGRVIRGNSALEAVSSGVLVLANKNLVTHHELVLPECHIESWQDAADRIRWFDAHPAAYREAIENQRKILYELYYKGPVEKLALKYWEKIAPK